MNKNKVAMAAVAMCVLGGEVVKAQPPRETTASFQYVLGGDQYVFNDAVKTTMSAPGGAVTFMGTDVLGIKAVAGRPFVGTEERRSLQVLGDGTRIEPHSAEKIYRDEQGRTRIERDGGKFVTIQDPATGTTVELDTTNRTARKSQVRISYQVRPGGPSEAGVFTVDQLKKQTAEAGAVTAARVGVTANRSVTLTRSGDFAVGTVPAQATAMADELHAKMMAETTAVGAVRIQTPEKTPKEELGTQMVNGVMAQGSRSTLLIPAGQIGNDRAIRVVGEQWYSNDLQMMVKSSNSDPRFGDTTYQLTGVSQISPDPSLFQIPADYTQR